MRGVHEPGDPSVALRPLTQSDLPLTRPWFASPAHLQHQLLPGWAAGGRDPGALPAGEMRVAELELPARRDGLESRPAAHSRTPLMTSSEETVRQLSAGRPEKPRCAGTSGIPLPGFEPVRRRVTLA
jgi:hypothetical protein